MAETKSITLDRVRGLIIGGALGDSLGAPHEFRYMKNIYTGLLQYPVELQFRFQQRYKYPVASFTDDCELSLTLARSLIRNKGYNEEDTIKSYLRWANSNSHMMGTNTRSLFKKIKTVRGYRARWNKNFKGDPKDWTQSNGSLMRSAPLSILPESKYVEMDCKLTNPSPVNIECSRVYVQACRMALQGQKPEDIFNHCLSLVKSGPVYNALMQVSRRERRDISSNKGWVVHAIYCACWCLRYYTNLEEAMKWVITQDSVPTGTGEYRLPTDVFGIITWCGSRL